MTKSNGFIIKRTIVIIRNASTYYVHSANLSTPYSTT
jgi:hypothetical protein